MTRLIARKLLLILLVLPLVNALGFFYAIIYVSLARSSSYRRLPQFSMPLTSRQEQQSYGQYLQGLLSGNLGQVAGRPVADILPEAVRNSLTLLAIAIVAMLLLGPLLGALSLSRRSFRLTLPALLVTTAGASLPGFFLGTAAIASIISISMHQSGRGTIIPILGYGMDLHLLLPVVTLAVRPTLQIARVTAGLLEHELQQDYVRTARSKGSTWRRIVWRHALPNVSAGVLVTIGNALRYLIGGLIVVETLFLWPGLGRIFTSLVGIRLDGGRAQTFFGSPELLAAVSVVFGIWFLLADLVASASAYLVDPRVRATEQGRRTRSLARTS